MNSILKSYAVAPTKRFMGGAKSIRPVKSYGSNVVQRAREQTKSDVDSNLPLQSYLKNSSPVLVVSKETPRESDNPE